MSENPLDRIADAMFRGRAFADTIDQVHRDTFNGLPSSIMMRAHAMRSSVQAQIINGDVEGYTLVDEYLGFGRVEIVRVETGQRYLLKARSALPFEASSQLSIFGDIEPTPGARPLLLLVYEFRPDTLLLSTASVERIRLNGRVRYQLLDQLTDAGTWSIDDIPDIVVFDQGDEDDYGDLSEDIRFVDREGNQE